MGPWNIQKVKEAKTVYKWQKKPMCVQRLLQPKSLNFLKTLQSILLLRRHQSYHPTELYAELDKKLIKVTLGFA